MRRSKASPELFDDFDSMLIKELLECWLILSDFSNVIFYFWQLFENNNYHYGNGWKNLYTEIYQFKLSHLYF